jgi:hypothetical protein
LVLRTGSAKLPKLMPSERVTPKKLPTRSQRRATPYR